MYRTNRNFSEFGGLVTDDWAFENAFFDFDKIVWAPKVNADKPLYVDDLPGDTSTQAELIFASFFGGNIETNGDDDWLFFDATANDEVRFTLGIETSVIDPIFRLYDGAGNVLLEQRGVDGVLFSGSIGLTLNYHFADTARYYVSVSSETGTGTGHYNVAAVFAGLLAGDDFAAGLTTSGIVNTNGPTTGVFQQGVVNDFDRDWFVITVAAGETLEVSVDNNAYGDMQIAFFNGVGQQLWNVSNDLDFANSRMLYSYTADSTQTVYIEAGGPIGAYEFNTRTFLDDYAADETTTGALNVSGDSINGAINFQGDEDWFAITLAAGEGIQIILEDLSNTGEAINITVIDPTNSVPSVGMPSAIGIGQTTYASEVGGTFYISISGPVGNYQLSVAPLSDDFAGNNSTTGVVNIGGVNQGQMNFSVDIDSFVFNVAAGDAIRLDLAYDANLGFVMPIIRDADGNVVDVNFTPFGSEIYLYQFDAGGTYYVDMRGGPNGGTVAPLDYAFAVQEFATFDNQPAVAPFFPANAIIWAPILNPGATPDVAPVNSTYRLDIITEFDTDGNPILVDNSDLVVAADEVFYSTDINGGIAHTIFASESNGTLENNGLLWVEASDFAYAVRGLNWDTVTNDGKIVAIGGNQAFGVDMISGGVLVNHGEIIAISYQGAALGYQSHIPDTPETVGQDTVINTGTIYAWSGQTKATGMGFGDGELVLENSGDISAHGLQFANALALGRGGTITNSGTITATTGLDNASFGINSLSELGSLNLTNTGTITADVAVAAFGVNTVNNSGILNGNVFLLGGTNAFAVDDTLINSGTINGDVDFRDNNDVYDGTGGFVDGVILMGAGNDVASGGAQSDFIFGEAGNDELSGGGGNDLLDGGLGNDQLFGGAGNDVANYLGALANYEIIDHGNGSYTVTDLVGAEGTDTLVGIERMRFSGLNSEIYNIVDIAQTPAGLIDGTAGAETIDGTSGDDVIFGRAGDDVLNGLAGDDRLVGGIGADTLNGGDGDDALDGSQGDDQLDGGLGFDFAVYAGLRAEYSYVVNADNSVTVTHNNGGADGVDTLVNIEGLRFADGDVLLGEVAEQLTGGDDVFTGTGGDDFINGLAGNDRISGLAGDDVVLGGAGRDTLNGGRGADNLYGGDDNDVLNGSHGDDNLNGGAGNDRLNGGQNNDTLNGDAGDDFLRGNGGNDILDGGLGSDTLVGASGNDILRGGSGDGSADTLHGGAGNDLLIVTGDTGNAGANFLNGNGGSDILRSGIGSDSLRGGGGSDELYGGGGDDFMRGGTGSDIIEGGAGNDTIFGDGAADTISGGAGDDLINGGGGNDIITGGTGFDVIEGRGGSDNIFGGAGNDRIEGGTSNDTLHGDAGDDQIFGDGGRDTLYGGAGFDRMYGGGGNDIMYGGADGDTMLGGRFDDQLFGGDGNDDLSGEEGVNLITGGAGRDIFFQTKGGHDVLLDFTQGEDKIDINDITLADFTALLAATTDGVDDGGVYVIVDMGTDGSFKIYGQTKASLLETDFNFGTPLPFAESVAEKRTIAEDVTVIEKPVVSDDDGFVFVEKAVVSDVGDYVFGDTVSPQDLLAEYLAQAPQDWHIYLSDEGILEISSDLDADLGLFTDYFEIV